VKNNVKYYISTEAYNIYTNLGRFHPYMIISHNEAKATGYFGSHGVYKWSIDYARLGIKKGYWKEVSASEIALFI
jgi:hypothetical protein